MQTSSAVSTAPATPLKRTLPSSQGTHSTSCPSSPRIRKPEPLSRWAGGSRKVPVATKIPSRPSNKENLRGSFHNGHQLSAARGRGAKVVKPVSRPGHQRDVKPSIEAIPPSRSPNMVSSRRVPDLHGKILAKIRAGRARSASKQDNTELSPSLPVTCEEVQQYLQSVFSICDTYNTGSLRAGNLKKYLSR